VYAMSNSSVFSMLRRNEVARRAERQSDDSEFQTERALTLKAFVACCHISWGCGVQKIILKSAYFDRVISKTKRAYVYNDTVLPVIE